MRDLSLHILDIVQNSIKANANIITIDLTQKYNQRLQKNMLELRVSDNGIGMDTELLNKAEDPFVTTRTSRKVGLGISLLKESALKCDGEFKLISQKNKGTDVLAAFFIEHVDRLPIGDVGDTMLTLLIANPEIQFILILSGDKGEFRLDTTEITNTLKGAIITEVEIINWLKEFVDEGIKKIFGGVLNEVNC